VTDWDNAYNEPGKLGLEIVGEACDAEANYSFDLFVVWKDAAGHLYYAEDSGCSCPEPFEFYREVSDLTAATVAEIHVALDEWADDSGGYTRKAPSAAELHRDLAMETAP
jgi:hypothetical protein